VRSEEGGEEVLGIENNNRRDAHLEQASEKKEPCIVPIHASNLRVHSTVCEAAV
jgi:hypothetical protein